MAWVISFGRCVHYVYVPSKDDVLRPHSRVLLGERVWIELQRHNQGGFWILYGSIIRNRVAENGY